MKIFGSCLLKNEADIIEETLEFAVTWCDHIIVDDNGSDDGTWEIVQDMAKTYPQIIPWRQKAQPYGDHLRGDPFRAFRHLSGKGDWWAKLDSDERYIDNPREFLEKVPQGHQIVAAVQFQYYFTDKDAEKAKEEESAVVAERTYERLHYYRCEYSETRFFRYRKRLVWPIETAWPIHLGVHHPRLIRNRHLQYRSLEQMRTRWNVRQQAIRDGCINFGHIEALNSWEEWIVPSETCLDDRDPNPWQIDYSKLPQFMEKPWHRALKMVMHGTGIWG